MASHNKQPSHAVAKSAVRTKTLVCKKNHKLLKEYGILKGQIVQIDVETMHIVKYYDKDIKQTRYIKLSKKLMKKFKE